jgi:hypothetical protein
MGQRAVVDLCATRKPAISAVANVARFQLSLAAFGGQGHTIGLAGLFAGAERLEVEMPVSRKEMRGSRAFTFPLFGIVLLLACYWLLADWQEVPGIVNSALAALHWPT